MKNADMPAMPVNNFLKEGDLAVSTNEFQGLTKREVFAMHAMQGLLSDGSYADLYNTADEWRKNITEASVEFADVLLEELEK
ncbi:hypothetical protein VPHK392_0016 [Vibrio phage K392]